MEDRARTGTGAITERRRDSAVDWLTGIRTRPSIVRLGRAASACVPTLPARVVAAHRRRERRRAPAILESFRPDWTVPPADEVHLTPTFRCNASCRICYQQTNPRELKADELSARDYIRLLSAIRPRWVKLIGGEVFLRDDLPEMIRGLIAMGSRVTVSTNGTLIGADTAHLLARLPALSEIGVTLECHADTPRGIWKGPEVVRELSRTTTVLGKFHLQHESIRPRDAVRRLAALGIRQQLAIFENVVSPDAIDETCALLASELGWTRDQVRLHVFARESGRPPADGSELADRIGEARREAAARRVSLVFNADVGPRALDEYAEGTRRARHRVTCGRLVHPRLFVTPPGEVTFCEYIRGSFGKPETGDDANAIANGERMRAFRRLLDERNLFPICERCCNLLVLD